MNQHTFEQTVLAYLDGMLDRREEHAFLDEVKRDPEKRTLLEQYRKLHVALEKQRSSYLPLRAERALTERIPALRNIPPLEDAALVHASKGLRSLLSVRRISVIILSGAALLSLLTVLQYSRITPDDAVGEPESPTTLPESKEVSERGFARNNISPDGVAPAEASTGRTEVSRQASDEDNGSVPSRHRNSAQHREGNADAAQTAIETIPVMIADLSNATSHPGQQNDAGLPSASLAMRGMHGGSTLRSIAPFPVNDRAVGFEAGRPFQTTRVVYGRRLQAYVESGAAMRETRRGDQPIGDGYGVQNLLGLRWEFDPFLAAGVEFGQSVLAREGQRAQTSSMEGSPEMDVIIVENFLEEAGRSWVRAHVFYTLNPGDLFQFLVTGGTGIVLGSDRNIMFSMGAAVQYPFRSHVYIRTGLYFSGSWLDASGVSPVLPQEGGIPLAYKYPSEAPGRLFNASVQFRIGVGYLLW